MASPYLLDVDTGIDDALAVAWMATHPDVDLVAATSIFGNVNTRQAARNTCDLLALLGRGDVPVAAGPDVAMGRRLGEDAAFVHGVNGIGEVELPRANRDPEGDLTAAEMIVRKAREHEGELHIVAVGPLTNLGLALQLEPELPRLVKKVTTMGGNVLVPGTNSARLDANTANDIDAAALAYAAPWDITMVGLDVTMRNVLDADQRQRLVSDGNRAVSSIGEMLKFYFGFYETIFGRPQCALHDPLAAAIATGDILPTVAPKLPTFVDLSDGPEQGSTVVDARTMWRGFDVEPADANVRVVLECGTGFGGLLTERLLDA